MEMLQSASKPRSTAHVSAVALPPTLGHPGRPWTWMVLTCLLFATSGVVRGWQEHRFDEAKHRVIKPLFALKDLPQTIGKWRAVQGEEFALDPQISRVAGSVDSIVRAYVDDTTGVVLTLVVLYGRAETMTGHTPEICYPASGFEVAGETLEVALPGNSQPARFRSLLFTKKGGTIVDREEVHYAFLHDGQWAPEVAGNWRVLRYSPPVFKVQVQRRVGEGEGRQVNNPTEQFLSALLPLIQERVDRSSS